MPEDPVRLLERAADQIAPPSDALERTARRRRRLSRNNTMVSGALALAVYAVGLAVLFRAFFGSTQPGAGGPRVPPPEGLAPKGIGSVEMIRSFGAMEAVALTEHAVIRTADGGLHWVSVTPPGFRNFASSALFYLDAQHGWIVSLPREKDGTLSVFRTADRGRTWNRASIALGDGLDYDALAPGHAQPPEIGFADPLHGWMRLPVTPSPLLVTSDGGATWEPGPMIDGEGDQFQGMTFTSSTEGWAVRELDIPLNPTSDLPIAALYRTLDAGATWQRVDLPPPPVSLRDAPYGPATELGLPEFFGPLDGVMAAWAGTRQSSAMFAYVTHDGGTTWSVVDPIPLHQGAGSPIFIPTFASATAWMVASTSGELALTSDAGQSWSIRSVRGIQPHQYPAALEFTSRKTGWAMGCDSWSGGLATPTSCGGRYTVYRTTDGGKSWTLMLTNLPTSRP
jgi:photosystem II stability/assembly factor-like uncharacterized protein